jgi:hypothetical protein
LSKATKQVYAVADGEAMGVVGVKPSKIADGDLKADFNERTLADFELEFTFSK